MENDLSRVVDSTTRLPEEALQESERFRLIIDGLPAFVTLMRPTASSSAPTSMCSTILESRSKP